MQCMQVATTKEVLTNATDDRYFETTCYFQLVGLLDYIIVR